MRIACSAVIVLSCSLMAAGQMKRTVAHKAAVAPGPQFKIGMSEADMVAQFGQPSAYWGVSTKRHIPLAEYETACRIELCQPIYTRKTESNEYEIRLLETVDESKSHLHPTIRIREIHFRLDHDMKPQEALNDIAEAHALCANGCSFETLYDSIFVAVPPQGAKRVVFSKYDDPLAKLTLDSGVDEVAIAELNQ